jgi:hypothetical protein
MVREDLTPGSRDWNIVCDPDSGDGIMALDGSGTGANAIECNCRPATTNASTGWQVVTNGMAPAYPNAWIRLQRTGTQLAAFYSTNGTQWTQHAWADPTTVGSSNALPATVYVGLCQTAHNNDPTPLAPLNELAFVDTASYDNLNFAYVAPVNSQVVMTITHSGGNVVISWSPASGTLYSSPALGSSAAWTAVPNAVSPMTIPIGKTDQFFRVQQ